MAAYQDFSSVYWIGGGSGGGKSTVARRLAERHGMRLYASDETMRDHSARCSAVDCPRLHEFMNMDMDERWMNRSPEVMLDTFHWFNGEGFDLIVEDLRTVPTGTRVLVEGFRLLPDKVRAVPNGPRNSVWLLPTPEFRRHAFESRGTLWDIAGKTSDPDRALSNLLERDRLFTTRLRGDVNRLGAPFIVVDGSDSQDELTDRSERALGLPSA